MSICGVCAFNVPSTLSPTISLFPRKLKHQHRFTFDIFAEKNDNDGRDFEDPNPGGVSNWGKEDTSDTGDGNFFSVITDWLGSEEGKEDIKTYTFSLLFALLLRFTIIEPRYIPSLSMYPTFEVGDQLAVEKVTKRIRPFNRNEVVVFNPPNSFREIMANNYGDTKRSKEALIKRIVAIEVRHCF